MNSNASDTPASPQDVFEDQVEGLMFFNEPEARALDAVAARIMPSEPDGLGAREAAVIIYIDRAVAGYFRDLQGIYRQGLQQLDAFCRREHDASFSELAVDVQDRILAELDSPSDRLTPAGEARPQSGDTTLSRFFAIVRDHTIQGMFCDPMYGGNRDFVGWRLIGFPGAQWEYTAEQMRPAFDATTIPVRSLADLRRTNGR